MAGTTTDPPHLVVVGAGIVGLAHAVEARSLGWRVTLVERDSRPVGASIRNFGHACVTAQSGVALDRATRARARWLQLAEQVGFWAGRTGTVVVARADDERAVLAEFAASRGASVMLLDDAGVRAQVPTTASDVLGGAYFPDDIRVDPREAAPAICRWLADQQEVTLLTGTACLGLAGTTVTTSRGRVEADAVVVCVNHDVDRLFPDISTSVQLRRCWLQMLRVTPPTPLAIEPGVLTGSSLLRYAGFAHCPSLGAVRARLADEQPMLLHAGINLMMTQLPGGDLLLGDTHEYGSTIDPFAHEAWDELLLAEGARLLGVTALRPRERWQGVYASAAEEFLLAAPHPGVRVASVTTGIGMSTAFGFAQDVLAELAGELP